MVLSCFFLKLTGGDELNLFRYLFLLTYGRVAAFAAYLKYRNLWKSEWRDFCLAS